jgi:hypothetical protein
VAYFNFVADEPAAEAEGPATLPDVAPVVRSPAQAAKGDSCGDKGGDCQSKSSGCKSNSCGSCFVWDPWVSFEFVNAWTKETRLPPLVTTNGVPGDDGVLPTGQILYGAEGVCDDWRAGGRLSLGGWFGPEKIIGFGGKFFIVDGEKSEFAVDQTLYPVLARPFFNSSVVNAQDSLIVARPGTRDGVIHAQAENDLMSAEAFARVLLHSEAKQRLDLIVGYHFSRINDSLTIDHTMTQTGGGFPVGTVFTFVDNFATKNEYHAAEIGLWGQYDCRHLTLSLMSKLSMGNMHQEVAISGQSTRTLPGPVFTQYNGGLLALGSNLGTFTDDKFVLAPEAEVKLSYHLTPSADLTVGYSLLCWDAVALAGRQIDTSVANTPTVNSTQLLGGALVGPNNPVLPSIRDSRFWVHSLAVGATVKF